MKELEQQYYPPEFDDGGEESERQPQEPRELDPQQWREFRAALSQVYGAIPQNTDAAYFTQPAATFRAASEQLAAGQRVTAEAAANYLIDLPEPYQLCELSDAQLQQLLDQFGPDVARADFISANLVELGRQSLPAGGACLIETFGLKLLAESPAVHNDPQAKVALAEQLVDNAPYYSQVTGALMTGSPNNLGVLYLEVFPWCLRAAELGVAEPLATTQAAYERIYGAVNRRALLINPEFTLLGVQFADLDLENGGQLEEWLMQAQEQLPSRFAGFGTRAYQPNGYLASWVRYTYTGPRMLEVLQDVVAQQFDISLADYNLLVRTKQKDHFSTPTNLFKTSFTPEEKVFASNYPSLMATALDNWQLQYRDQYPNGFMGFDDWMWSGEIVHMSTRLNGEGKKMPATAEGLAEVMESPLRLSRNNIPEHFAVLETLAMEGSCESQLARLLIKKAAAVTAMQTNLERKKETLAQNPDAAEAWLSKELRGVEQLTARLEQAEVEYQQLLAQMTPAVLCRVDQIIDQPQLDVLPLANNLMVSHAVQLSFDPDMRAFVQDVVAVEASQLPDAQKLELVSQAMQQILPKLKEYLAFILLGGEYPESRFQSMYQVVLEGN